MLTRLALLALVMVTACHRAPEQVRPVVEPAVVGAQAQRLAPDTASCRLVGTWRPLLSSQQEAEVATQASNACFGSVFDASVSVSSFVEAATITFHPDGRWSAPLLNSVRPEDVWRWRFVEDEGDHAVAWISDSPYGPARNVTFVFRSPHEFEVRDFYGSCDHYTRVKDAK